MTGSIVGESFGGAQPVIMKIDPAEAATGVDKAVALPDGRTVTVRIPPGVSQQAMMFLPEIDPVDPAAPHEVFLWVLVEDRPPAPTAVPAPTGSAADQPGTGGAVGGVPRFAGTGLRGAGQRGPRRRRSLLVGITALVAVLLVTGVGGVYLARRGIQSAARGTAVGVRGSTPTANAVPSTPEAYQESLAAANAALAAAFERLTAARTDKSVSAALEGLRQILLNRASQLSGVAPPAVAATPHGALTTALADLTATVAGLVTDQSGPSLCAGVSALARITGTRAATAVRAASDRLATADPAHPYTFGSFLPPVVTDTTRQLANGAYVKKAVGGGGAGRLTVDNTASTSDSVVTLAPVGSKAALFTMYVRAAATAIATGIRNGSYEVYMVKGVDWDPSLSGFTRDCRFQKFITPIAYAANGNRYDNWTITMDSPASGQPAASTEVDPADVPIG